MSEQHPGFVQPARFEARHFDGQTAESRLAMTRVDAAGVWVIGAEGTSRLWPFAELVLVRGEGRDEPVQLERRADPVEVLIVPDHAFFEALRAALPAGTRLVRSGGWSPNPRVVIGLLLAAIALVFGLYRFAVPALADFVAGHVPASWERRYGDAMIEALAPEEDRVRDTRLLRPAEKIQHLLTAEAGGNAHEYRLIVLQSGVPNAFAAPGGHVVVTTGLLTALGSTDELAAVIAHEHGHIRRGHVMRAIMRRLSLDLLLGLVAGDQSALSGGLRAAGELGELSFSREHEREADDQAIELLTRSGASPIALADALESIGRGAPGGIPLGFLSTHPAPEERSARIRAAAASFTSHADGPAWRSAAGWEEMKAALAEGPPRSEWADSTVTLIPGGRDRETAGGREASAADGDGEPLPKYGDFVYVEDLPEAITKVPPEYPERARRAEVQGVVLVQALVGRDGRVKDTRVVTPIPALNDAAVAAVRQWVFKPALADGKPVAVWVAIPVKFTLQ